MNDLLHSFEGQSGTSQTDDTDNPNRCVFWKPVFGINRELKNLFCDIGGQTADVCFVDGYTNSIMDKVIIVNQISNFIIRIKYYLDHTNLCV